jgi:hypothetical protein
LNAAALLEEVRTSEGPLKSGTNETTRPTTTSATPMIVMTRFTDGCNTKGGLSVLGETKSGHSFGGAVRPHTKNPIKAPQMPITVP